MNKARKIINCIFVIAFVALLIYPFLRLDTTEIIDSATENRRMTMWPGLHLDGSYNEWYGHYVEDRVAFREQAAALYMNAVYRIFGEFAEDLHMYAKEGEIFPADKDYISAYQHLATDEQLIDSLVTYLDRSNTYLKGKGKTFVFLAGLDKKTVYPEKMPDYIHVDESRESIMDNLTRKLEEKGVPYVIDADAYRKASSEGRLYNKLTDTAHWNADGLMLGMEMLNEKVWNERVYFSDSPLPRFDRDWFERGSEIQELEFLSLPITEEVPAWQLKSYYADQMVTEEGFLDKIPHIEGPYAEHIISNNAESELSILIFGDSFMQTHMQYLAPQYHDIYSVGRQNYEYLQQYVELLDPDVVVFENAERSFVDDLYNYTRLGEIEYK